MKNIKFIAVSTSILMSAYAHQACAGYKFDITEKDSIEFGGYLKADIRYVDGTVPYRDYWIGAGVGQGEIQDSSQIKFNARESRFNTKYTHDKVTAFFEIDFYGSDGNEIISNSYSPRLRHAYISYENWLIGQTWSTFMNTSSLPETLNFGGTLVGETFVRQGQLRFTYGGFALALENPETYGGVDNNNDDIPDMVAKYTLKRDWGNVSIAGLFRQVDPEGVDEFTAGFSLAGRIKTFGKDDFRFQINEGEMGRYVGTTAARDVFNNEVEETSSFNLGYRHFWTSNWRSTLFYGETQTDEQGTDRSQYGINLLTDLTPSLTVGIEYGKYQVDDDLLNLNRTSDPRSRLNEDSDYVQLSAKFVL